MSGQFFCLVAEGVNYPVICQYIKNSIIHIVLASSIREIMPLINLRLNWTIYSILIWKYISILYLVYKHSKKSIRSNPDNQFYQEIFLIVMIIPITLDLI